MLPPTPPLLFTPAPKLRLAVEPSFTSTRMSRVSGSSPTGAMLTDQGVITGRADETLRLRKLLDAERIRIYADVLVKHAVPLGPVTLEDAVRDAVDRGLADAIIVTGNATGQSASPGDVHRAVEVANVPVYVGSGVTADNLREFVPPASGVIVGSWLKMDGAIANPVDARRVERLRSQLEARRM